MSISDLTLWIFLQDENVQLSQEITMVCDANLCEILRFHYASFIRVYFELSHLKLSIRTLIFLVHCANFIWEYF